MRKGMPWLICGVMLVCLADTVEAQSLSDELRSADSAELAQEARDKGNAVQGAILFHQANIACSKCHASGATDRLGPDLTSLTDEKPDSHWVDSVLFPSREIKDEFATYTILTADGLTFSGRIISTGPDELVVREDSGDQRVIRLAVDDIEEQVRNDQSSMPEGLVDELKDRQQFLDLIKYVMQIRASGSDDTSAIGGPSLTAADLTDELRGRILIDELNCRSCHQQPSATVAHRSTAPLPEWMGGALNPDYLQEFIVDPQPLGNHHRMPDLLGERDAAERTEIANEITHFLVSLANTSQPIVAHDRAAAERGEQLYHAVGCVACHAPRDANGADQEIPDSITLGTLHRKFGISSLVAYLEDPHAARPHGRMPNMKLTHWEALDIAHFLLTPAADVRADGDHSFDVDARLATLGRKKFTEIGCVQCHATDSLSPEREYPDLNGADLTRGCLSETSGGWPQYDLAEGDRDLIRAALVQTDRNLADEEQIVLDMAKFNCISCHTRGDWGGISADLDEYFQTTDLNLGNQGRIPPTLTGVGAKLNPQWTREVLVSGRAIRPYMLTRMPQFGADQVGHLVDAFHNVDQLPTVEFAEVADAKAIKQAGLELAGRSGLNCIACHTYRYQPSETMPAVDLTEMTQRLDKTWFYQYMRDPQRFSPNTVMPSFWPGGRPIRPELLEGQVDLQIEALWTYLSDGRDARPPRGLIREPLELLASDETVMLRRSYQGIGKRGIGVGYPSQINLAYDAEQMRLGMLWKGKFAETSGVWRGQGSGNVRPLGVFVIQFATGPELDFTTDPWIVDDGRPPNHRFQGYYLDEMQRPTFQYRFDDVEVEDYPVDVIDEETGTPRIRRQITFRSERKRRDVRFRVASGESIEALDNGSYQVGRRLVVKVDAPGDVVIVDTESGQEMLVPLMLDAGETEMVVEYAW